MPNSSIFLKNDSIRRQVPAFIPDPDKSQVTSAMTGTITFGKTGSPTVNIAGWTIIAVRPTADSTYYYNTDSTKTARLIADVVTLIWVGQSNVDKVTLVLGTATTGIQAM